MYRDAHAFKKQAVIQHGKNPSTEPLSAQSWFVSPFQRTPYPHFLPSTSVSHHENMLFGLDHAHPFMTASLLTNLLSARRISSSYSVHANAELSAFRAIRKPNPSNKLRTPSSLSINLAACAMFE